MTILSVSNFSKNFGKKQVFQNISFSIIEEGIYCFLGKSGCGKTTMLRCIAGLDKNYKGAISIGGENQSDYFQNKTMGRISQKYSNFPFFTVRKNITDGIYGKDQLVDSLLDQFEMKNFADFYPGQLSGGMNQRVAIMRCLVQNNDIICADEPFGALDVTMRASAQIYFQKTIKKNRKTAIVVTHDIDEALLIADAIYIFNGLNNDILFIENELNKLNMEENIRYSPNFLAMKQKIEVLLK